MIAFSDAAIDAPMLRAQHERVLMLMLLMMSRAALTMPASIR